MPILPSLRCPACGRNIKAVNAKEVPPAEKYEDCLRRCERCGIGASNAKSPAKVKFLRADRPRPVQRQDLQPAEPRQEDPAGPAHTPEAEPGRGQAEGGNPQETHQP